METKPRHLKVEFNAGTNSATTLKRMYDANFAERAANVFDGNVKQKFKIDNSDIIEVTSLHYDNDNNCYTFNFSVKSDQVEGIAQPLPINKIHILKLHKRSERADLAIDRLKDYGAYQFDGYWWSVTSMDDTHTSEVHFTLKNPCKHLGDWELMHKPMNIRGDISSEPVSEPKQPDIVYIAGAISGDVVANRHRFAAAKHSIMASSTNTTVLNPAELPDGLTQTQYMSICLPMVMMSTSLFMLKGWEKSEGAVAEHALAQKLKIEIVYQGEHDGKL